MGFLTGTKSKVTIDPITQSARAELLKRGLEEVDIPARQIQPLTQTELDAIARGEEFAAGGITPELLEAIELTRGIATDTSDITQDPGLQAIFREITKQGDIQLGRVGRAAQKRGVLSSTRGGRDVLGRTISDVEGRKVAASVPFLEAEKNRRFNAILNLAGLGERKTGEEQQRIKTGLQIGGIPRAIEQATSDEKLNAILQNLQFRFGTQANILQGVSTTGTNIVSPGGPSGLEKLAVQVKAGGEVAAAVGAAAAGFPGATSFGGGGSSPPPLAQAVPAGGSGGNLNNPNSFNSSSFFRFN